MASPIGHAQLAGSTVPQHATFAHSKEDVLNALAFYFGQPVSPEKLKDYNETHAATYHFPGTQSYRARTSHQISFGNTSWPAPTNPSCCVCMNRCVRRL